MQLLCSSFLVINKININNAEVIKIVIYVHHVESQTIKSIIKIAAVIIRHIIINIFFCKQKKKKKKKKMCVIKKFLLDYFWLLIAKKRQQLKQTFRQLNDGKHTNTANLKGH